jgi:hypothetical protein
MLFKNSVRTSSKICHTSVTKIIWLICKEIIDICSDNHMKLINTLRKKYTFHEYLGIFVVYFTTLFQ